MPDPLDWIDEALAALEAAGLRRQLTERAGPQGGAAIDLGGRRLVNFGSNDYLGLAADPRLAAAVQAELAVEGWGAGASPLVTGRSALHARLERALAEFEGAEAALFFPSGFAANAGTIPALVESDDLILSDAKNHASLIDGCRLSRATVRIYRHADPADAARILRAEGGRRRRRLIVTDTLFSMDGDLAPLPALAELAEAHQAMLLVDEAHATGVFGARGRGVSEALGVEERVDVRIGTLSKALGCSGGFVTGRRKLIDWLANRARPYVFSTAPPAALAAAALAALEIVRTEPNRRSALLARAAALREGLRQGGYPIGNSASQIVPIVLGDPQRTMAAAAALREAGLFVPGIRPPTVPAGESLLRVSLTCGHADEHLTALLNALRRRL